MDKTLLKGLTVLEALAGSERPRGVTDLAAELGLVKSNVHRVLKTLEAAGYVTRGREAATYAPSLKLWLLGSQVHARSDLAAEAQPFLAALAAASRETVHLSVLEDRDVIYLAKIDSPEPVRAYTNLGGRAPAHCVATGKVLLAFLPEALRESYATGLHAYTPRTITDGPALLQALAAVRDKGFSLNLGEWRETVRGAAAPIRNSLGNVVAAVGISGPSEHLTQKRLGELVPHVVQAADRLSAALGFPGQTNDAGGRAAHWKAVQTFSKQAGPCGRWSASSTGPALQPRRRPSR